MVWAAAAAILLTGVLIIMMVMMRGDAPKSGPDVVLMRACPICGKELKIGENILAERTGVVKAGRERIVIKGCVHCLKRV